MRRVVVEAYGPPGVMRVIHCGTPDPGPDQVLVEVAAAGVNFIDIYQRTGAYTVRFPWTPGVEGSGIILRAGAEVRGFAPGDRVAWAGCPGGYATHCLVPAGRLVPVPDAVSLPDAAAVLLQGMTAHFLASDVLPLRAGACLVHAAAGGVGGLLCQLAARRGIRVIGTVSHPGKEAAARANGASEVIDYGRTGFADRVRDVTHGWGVDVVYDAVGRDTFMEGLDCLRPRGTMVLYGQSSGPVDPVDPQALNARGSLFLTKASLSHYDTTRDLMLRRARAVFDDLAAGRLRVRVHATYPLAEAARAHAALESRRVIGKVLLDGGARS